MRKISFRQKIIGTIILMVSLVSVVSFTIFSVFLSNKLLTHTEESFNQIDILKNQYYYTISKHDGRVIKDMLINMKQDKNVLRTYLVNARLKVVYPDTYPELYKDTNQFAKLFSKQRDITIVNYNDGQVPFSRVFIRLQNVPSCHSCHNPAKQTNLGMIVMDLKNDETRGIMALTKRFSVYYTIFILLSIFSLVAYLHYKYIRKSIKQFKLTIKLINQGNLSARLEIPEAKELGGLSQDFNSMLDTFENAQNELQLYHKKQLQNSQKLATIGEMSARVAHEIRNPITGISRAVEVIISELKDDGNKPILEEIQRQANRVNLAITNMLKYSSSKELNKQNGNVNDIIESLLFFLENQAHDKIVNFESDLSKSVPATDFDHELIENVLLNLSLNAIQSIPENGTIIYKSSYDSIQKKIIISVIDNGSGIPLEIGLEVFNPFYTTHTQGTGLGLAISKDIIEKHNGELWFENNKESGCAFFIALPL
ncbi:MAG: sensor histidine kinase [Bacteroidales bacterium]